MPPEHLLEFLASIYNVNKEDINITYYNKDDINITYYVEEVEVTKPSNKGRKPKPHQITDKVVEPQPAGI